MSGSRMNILFCMNHFPGIGGVESITSTLIDCLGDEMGIHVLSFSGTEGMALPEKVRNYYLLPPLPAGEREDFYNRVLRENSITHVISQGMYPHLTDLIFNAKRDRSVKVISVLHGMPGYEMKEVDMIYASYRPESLKWNFFRKTGLDGLMLRSKKRRHLERYRETYRRAASEGDALVLLAEAYLDDLCRIYSLEEYRDKMSVIPNCLPASWQDIAPVPFEEKENLLIFVGRLSVEKRVDRVLRVWADLQGRKDWKLLIVGDGPCRGEAERLAAELGLENLSFEGYSMDAAGYCRRAKILLQTSEFEGFSMVLIEAQRFSTVPVTFTLGGSLSALSDGGGVLVEYGNVGQMAAETDRLMGDETLLRALSASSYRKSENWTAEHVCGQWKMLINKI